MKTLPTITLIHCSQIAHAVVGNAIRGIKLCRDLEVIGHRWKTGCSSSARLTANELWHSTSAGDDPQALRPRYPIAAPELRQVGTLTEAKVEEFDLDAGLRRVPHGRRKNRRHTTGPFVIPLPRRLLSGFAS